MYKHLHSSVLEAIHLGNDEKIKWIKEPKWIGYARARDILTKLDDLLHHPRESRMPNMLLVGSTNNGKTKLIKHFAQKHAPQENPGGDYIIAPVLYFQAPPSPSEAGLYSEILNSLFERVPSASIDAKRARVIQVLRGIQAKVLIIDELHNILAGASVKQQQFLNMIKYIGNELEISIVGCGTGDLLRAVSVDEQIQNRFIPEILPTWKMNKEFRQLLMSFESLLPLKEPSNLHEKLIASKILAMSEGSIGEISTLLNTSAIYAVHQGVEKITEDILNDCGYIAPDERKGYAANV
jgi:hypothetical protein